LDLSIFKDEVYFWHVSDDSIDMINFQDIQTRFPSKLKNPQKLNMLEQAKAILKRLNISSGVYHFEFKYDKDKAYLIELNPRCPGGNYVNSYSKLYGSDLDYDDLLIALNRRPFKK
jgi:biotin carboxylase